MQISQRRVIRVCEWVSPQEAGFRTRLGPGTPGSAFNSFSYLRMEGALDHWDA